MLFIYLLYLLNLLQVRSYQFSRVYDDKQMWRTKACPVEMAVYNCYFQGMKDRAEVIEHWIHPDDIHNNSNNNNNNNNLLTNNIKEFHITDLVNKLYGKTVLFYGDSLMLQTFVGTVCNIYNTEGITSEFNITWSYRDWLGPINCPYGGEHCELLSSSCVIFTNEKLQNNINNKLKLCFEWNDGVNEIMTNKLELKMKLHKMTLNDIVVASMGTWFFQDHNIAGALKFFKYSIDLIINEIKKLNLSNKNFYWLECPPQHFDGKGIEPGYYKHDQSHHFAAAADKYLASNFKLPNPCVPFADLKAAYNNDYRNRIPEQMFGDTIHFIKTWKYLAEVYDAHVTTPRRTGRSFVLDCSHWCMPGPIVHVFARAFSKVIIPFHVDNAPLIGV